MILKLGEVTAIKEGKEVIYYDGFDRRVVDLELLRLFVGEQVKEMKDLLGRCIQVCKDRSGRIENIYIID